MDDWAAKRLAELEAAAPKKRKKKAEPFARVPLWWMVRAAKAADTPDALVCVYLLYAAWKAKGKPFPLSNKWLKKNGASREIKRRVLRDLEAAGLITVERRHGRSPRVALTIR
jgi:ribosomal protein S19E (S16A)